MERDAFEIALATALDILPREALITSLHYREGDDESLHVTYRLDGQARQPLVISLESGEAHALPASLN